MSRQARELLIVILIMILLTSEPEAREVLIADCNNFVDMMILAVVEVILFIFMKI